MRNALVVGIDYYEHISALYGCVLNAVSVSTVLERHWDQRRNFYVRLMTGEDRKRKVSRVELRKAVKELFSKDLDVALFYFAGHGHLESPGGYLLTSDSESGNTGDGLSLADVLKYAEESRSRNTIIVLDCCHAMAMGTEPVNSRKSELSKGLTLIAASTAKQYSYEDFAGGVFTDLFVDALKGEARNLMGDITPGSVYAHIDQSLSAWDQRPVYKTNVMSFVSLRQVEPPISLADLTRIVEFFPDFDEQSQEYFHQLDPSYEPDSDAPDPERNEIFKILQRYNRVNLVVPIDADHMYYAAMTNKPCKLTMLGKHYRKLVEKGRI